MRKRQRVLGRDATGHRTVLMSMENKPMRMHQGETEGRWWVQKGGIIGAYEVAREKM